MTEELTLHPGTLTLAEMREVADARIVLRLDEACRASVDAAQGLVETAAAEGQSIYGVTTGFGSLADAAIPRDRLSDLQRRLVLSNAAGTGPLLADATVRRILVLKINTLALARSGVRYALIDALVRLFNHGVVPCIPAKGSVGASGDLAPLAHLGATLLGVGEVRVGGRSLPAAAGLTRAGLPPLELAPKEGLAIVNGTQVSTALALEGLFALEDAFAAAIVAGALSLEAALGSDMPFDPRIQAARGQKGQADVAAVTHALLAGSGVRAAQAQSGRVQDPYSLRCQPQVMGACLDCMRFTAELLAREINSVTDNPLVFVEDREVLYGGNFHAEPIGLAADIAALVIAEAGSMAERRIALLTDAHLSGGLPPFLVAKSGLNSGFMVAHVTAAALASENKALAHPGSIDSLPTAANQEDFVSMATYAARRLADMADNLAGIVAIELLAARQGVHLRRPLRSSPTLEAVIEAIAARVPTYDEDRFFAPDIAAIKELVSSGYFRRFVPPEILPSAGGSRGARP